MKIFFSILLVLLLFGINNTFSSNSVFGNLTYTSISIKKECQNQIRNSNSGRKYIPSINDAFAPPSANSDLCESYGYYGGVWSSSITKGTNYLCPDKGYASDFDDLGLNYRVFCMYRLKDEDIELNSAPLSSFGVADGQEKNIEISFPLTIGNLETLIDSISFTFDFIDNTSINWLTKNKNTISSSAVVANNIFSESFTLDKRTVTYTINNSNLTIFKNGTNNGFNFKYKFYNPTKEAGTSNDAFIIKTMKYSINFTDGGSIDNFLVEDSFNDNNIYNSNIVVNTTPLYNVDITGEIANNGFIGGIIQTGSLDIFKNGTVITTDNKLYFVQSGSTMNYFTGTGQINSNTKKTIEISNTSVGTEFISSFTTTNYILKTIFTLINPSGLIDDIKDIRLYKYIKYTVGGKAVTYLAGILNESNNQNFDKLKIYGITNINKDKQKDLIVDQDVNDIQNLNGKITKAGLKRDIKRAAIKKIKFVNTEDETQSIGDLTGNTWEDIGNGGKVLGNILYYDDLNGDNVELGNGSELSITGKKTIIVIGGNLYIKSNIINDNNSSILGIIVLKDENGNGGKVYIDTSVQKVDAIMYMDKSIISYNESYDNGNSDNILKKEVDLNINSNIIKNQLYIYGSVFSENTIGGSRLDPPVCPFWTQSIVGFNCNIKEAQKYDLNYLRIGNNNKYDSSYADYPIIIKYNSSMQSTPPPLFFK